MVSKEIHGGEMLKTQGGLAMYVSQPGRYVVSGFSMLGWSLSAGKLGIVVLSTTDRVIAERYWELRHARGLDHFKAWDAMIHEGWNLSSTKWGGSEK